MDELIPPIIRDSRWFMFPIYWFAYRGKLVKEAMEFKSRIAGLGSLGHPRGLALAEVYWSPKASRNWDGFIVRMEAQFPRLDAEGIKYARSA